METNLGFFPQYTGFDPISAVQALKSQADWVGLRFVDEITHYRGARNGQVDQNMTAAERGVMLEAMVNGQIAYAATSDLSPAGLQKAMTKAVLLAKASSEKKSLLFTEKLRPKSTGNYTSPRKQGLDQVTLSEFTDFMIGATKKMQISDKIVNADASAIISESTYHYLSSSGSDFQQNFLWISNNFGVNATEGTISQRRTMNGPVARCYQMGLEAFDEEEIYADCEKTARQALELLTAEECPRDKMDLILSPDQLYLQIHESIGHPLELDRILGDERNYAGWSFIKPSDFGNLQYGTKLMNVTFDPTLENEYASYAFDDCGNHATKEYLIKDGKLLRGLGSLESQARLNLPGVANFRAASWNRAPIDRMANINLEPGASSLAEMIAMTEKGIYMQANKSWSIDDYRNKFQFGCEYAQLIENGKITKTVRNPNYRGATIPFWNSLKAVARREEFEVHGSPYCGKGEPSQVIRVGPCVASLFVFTNRSFWRW
jgi:predicted Zn-dependent protease